MDSDEGKLFIGGISWETTEDRLADYFKAYGDVVDAVIMRDRATGRARGFGFVVFADPTVADRVQLEKHTIDGRAVEAKKAVPRGEQQNFSRSNNTNVMSGGQIRTKKIFVGGLASTVTEEDFKSYFQQFGNITDVVVMYDHNTQRPRGFGFITFDSEDAVDRVLQKPFHELREKMVEVKRAIPKELSSGIPGRPGTAGYQTDIGRGASSFGGYGQGYNSSPGSGYGSRVDNRYAATPASRGTYPTYGPGGYVTGGYGTGSGYGPPMNGSYGPAGFTGGASYAAPAGYGGPPSGTGFAAPGVTGYGTPPTGARSPWGPSAGGGYASVGSPAGYGAGPSGGGMGGYTVAGMVSGGIAQPNGGSAGYGSGAPAYGTGDSGYGPTTPGYGARSATTMGATGYGDTYTGSTYGDSSWQAGAADSHASPASGSMPGATVAYGMGGGIPADAQANGPANYGGGYATGRQTQRGSDGRFRPYPAANERTA